MSKTKEEQIQFNMMMDNSSISIESIQDAITRGQFYNLDEHLFYALSRQSPEAIIQLFIKNGASLNESFNYACGSNNLSVIKDLINRGVDPTRPESFTCALNANNLELAQYLLEQGTNIDAIDKFSGKSALHNACEAGQVQQVQWLIKAGASIDLVDRKGQTPFQRVMTRLYSRDAHSADKKIALLLVESGANIHNVIYNTAGTPVAPLTIALNINGRFGYSDISLVRALIRKGADVNVPDLYHFTLLNLAISKGDADTLREFIAAGVDINDKAYGSTMLHLACRATNAAEVKLLLDAGADVNIANLYGYTALHMACAETMSDASNIGLVKLLLDAGADINIANQYGDTALNMACSAKKRDASNIGLVKLLLDAGADVNIANQYGDTALHSACAVTMQDASNIGLVKLLLDTGADVNAPASNGRLTPFEMLLHHTQGAELIAKLCEKGMELNIEQKTIIQNKINDKSISPELVSQFVAYADLDMPSMQTIYSVAEPSPTSKWRAVLASNSRAASLDATDREDSPPDMRAAGASAVTAPSTRVQDRVIPSDPIKTILKTILGRNSNTVQTNITPQARDSETKTNTGPGR